MNNIPAFIPEIARLFQGTDYDIAVSENASFQNEFTAHPIEDPKRSFLTDHNREAPAELRVAINVATVACSPGGTDGVERLTKIQDALLAMRAAQSVDNEAMTTIFTGVRFYRNMAIASLDFDRDAERPNLMAITISFREVRFARSPRLSKERYLLHGNDGPIDSQNRRIVAPNDRPIIEAVRVKRQANLSLALPNEVDVIRFAVRSLAPIWKAGLNLTSAN